MKCKLSIILTTMLLTATLDSWASDGATLYKKKCASCHVASGEGKPAIKAPALKGTALDANQLLDRITKGEATSKAPHNKGIAGVSEAHASAIAEYIKSLK